MESIRQIVENAPKMSILGRVLQDWRTYRKAPPVPEEPDPAPEPRRPRPQRPYAHVPAKGVRMASLLLQGVAERHGISREEIMGRRKSYKNVAARNELIFLLHEQGWSLSKVARYLGKHHTTVMHSLAQYKRRLASQNEKEDAA